MVMGLGAAGFIFATAVTIILVLLAKRPKVSTIKPDEDAPEIQSCATDLASQIEIYSYQLIKNYSSTPNVTGFKLHRKASNDAVIELYMLRGSGHPTVEEFTVLTTVSDTFVTLVNADETVMVEMEKSPSGVVTFLRKVFEDGDEVEHERQHFEFAINPYVAYTC
jgi:hypothetical protein